MPDEPDHHQQTNGSNHDEGALHSAEIKSAREMMQSGATPGMVRIQLREKGFADSDCDFIVKRATIENTSQARLKGLWWFASGSTMVLVGLGIIWYRINNLGTIGRSPIFIIIGGLVLLGKGLVTAVAGIDNKVTVDQNFEPAKYDSIPHSQKTT